MSPALRETVSTALTLLVFSVVGASLLSGVFTLTSPTIELSVQADKLALVSQTLPAGSFDNDLIRDAIVLPANPQLGLKRPGQAYVARKQGNATAVVLEAIAPDGYAGEIRLLIGIQADGRVTGVRVTAHKETPGLGDYIEIARNPWINQFTGKSLIAPADTAWKVRKDGGVFNYMAGATITPRAVVKAVNKALHFFESHKDELLAPQRENRHVQS
ncbi:MAG: electron transport complex subunit RsxG [Hydrogenophilales bacterium 28-61-23]|nr:MAG: electron transport complex subunit RsxG [Hydrogenophilales bacterium 28-61-23]